MIRHVQLPNDMTSTKLITPQDLLIYVSIKRDMNGKTRTCFPSLATISKRAGCSINTVRKSIQILKDLDYISVTKSGKRNIYYFNTAKNFEPFSYEFLDKEDLTFKEKAYLLATQQFMIKENNEGKVSYTNSTLSSKINMSESSISRCNKSLVNKQYLTILDTKSKDLESGTLTSEKMFHLTKFEQQVVFVLKNHEDRITSNEEKIAELEKKLESMAKDQEILIKNNYALQQQLRESKNLNNDMILHS